MRWVVESDPLGALIPFWEHIVNLNVFGCTLDDSINRYMPFFQNLFSLLLAYIWKLKLHPVNKYFRNWDELFRFPVINLFVERTYDLLMKIWKLISILTSYLINWHIFFIIVFFILLHENFQTICAWNYGLRSGFLMFVKLCQVLWSELWIIDFPFS